MGTNTPVKLDILVGALESAAGTAETLADADFDVRVRNVELSVDYPADDESSKYANGSDAEDIALIGATSCTVSFSTWIAWGGAVDTAPNFSKFLTACGLKTTTHTTTGISYAPEKAEGDSTMTFEMFRIQRGASPSAVRYKVAGAMGNVVLMADVIGGGWKANFEFKGKLADVDTVASGSILELTGSDTTIAEKLLANVFTVGATPLSISSFSLDAGNAIEGQTSQADATGYDYFRISSRAPRFSCNPYSMLPSTYDHDAIVRAQTLAAISLASSAASPHFTISAPRAQLMSPGISSREGDASFDFNYRLLENTAGANAAEKEHTWELLQGAKS